MQIKGDIQSQTSRPPKHVIVLSAIRRAIDSGQYAAGDRLPDERQLADEFQVSRTTVRQALAELSKSGIVERLQGSGTYIRNDGGPRRLRPRLTHRLGSEPGHHPAVARQMVAILPVGPFARFSTYVGGVTAYAERSITQRNLRLVVRYVDDHASLPQIVQETCNDPAIIGGLVVGEVHEADAAAMVDACIPWVVVGDFVDASRSAPVIDQVSGDNYRLAELSTQTLLQQGCRRPALLASDPGIWRDEKISAFRTVCYSQGISAGDQIISELMPDTHHQQNASSYHHAVRERARQILDEWHRTDRWPDGVVIPGAALLPWIEQVRLHPQANRLRDCPLVAMDHDLHSRSLRGSIDHPNLSWCEIGISDVADQAVYRLLVNPRLGRSALRDYIRHVRVIGPHAGHEEPAAVSPTQTPSSV